jgi:hypothetical protein
MPGYIKAALHKYQHPAPTHPEHAPHQCNPPVYCAKTVFVEDKKDIPALSPKYVNCLQQLVGTLLYYARAVDPTLIMPVNVLASEQTRATAATIPTVSSSCGSDCDSTSYSCGDDAYVDMNNSNSKQRNVSDVRFTKRDTLYRMEQERSKEAPEEAPEDKYKVQWNNILGEDAFGAVYLPSNFQTG